jgi:ATP-binding protein involved in chromosome partitioning
MAPDAGQIERIVGQVLDPELDLALGEAGMVRSVRTRRHRVAVELALPVSAWPNTDALEARVRQAAGSVPGVEEVTVELTVMTDPERAGLRHRLRGETPGDSPAGHDHAGHDHGGGGHGDGPTASFLEPGSTTRVIGVSSGKGGVGKSSVTVNLAVALAQAGHRVAVLDADVYGFSVPKMLGTDHDPVIIGDLVVPSLMHGVRCLSMGFFVEDEQPVIWRGPMLHKALEQFVGDAYWGHPDFLLVDMPPGTGDVTLSMATVMPRTEVVVVTTPQPAAQRVAQRSAFAARKLKLSVRGVIENMSWFTGDDGKRYELFGSGGGRALADDLGVPLLGQVPLVPALRQGSDDGRPVVVAEPDSEAARCFSDLATRLADLGPARVYRSELTVR